MALIVKVVRLNRSQIVFHTLLSRLFLVGWGLTNNQASVNKGNQMNDTGDQTQSNKRNDKQCQKSEKSSAQSSKNEIDHGVSPFRWRFGSMSREPILKVSAIFLPKDIKKLTF